MKTDQATTKYKCYDAAFKHSDVEHWMLSGKSARIIAGELGINEQSLHKWKQQFKATARRAIKKGSFSFHRPPIHHSSKKCQRRLGVLSAGDDFNSQQAQQQFGRMAKM